MRRESTVIRFARGLVDLIAEEAATKSDFAQRLEGLFNCQFERKPKEQKPVSSKEPMELPDIYAEWRARGETEFRLWLRDQPVSVLRMLIRRTDLMRRVAPRSGARRRN